jgi:hypothetical protein
MLRCPSARDASTYGKVRLCTPGLVTPRYPSKIAAAAKKLEAEARLVMSFPTPHLEFKNLTPAIARQNAPSQEFSDPVLTDGVLCISSKELRERPLDR